jgi:hypothetical protein
MELRVKEQTAYLQPNISITSLIQGLNTTIKDRLVKTTLLVYTKNTFDTQEHNSSQIKEENEGVHME